MGETTFQHVVVGSGISGLTAALLLAHAGRRVLLLEKAPTPGGSLARFRRQGIPFDTGFHFTGGLSEGGLLQDMLRVLGLWEHIEPVILDRAQDNRFVMETTGRVFDFPIGVDPLKTELQSEFPSEREAIEQYFKRMQQVCDRTRSMDLRMIHDHLDLLDEDYISLQQVLDQLTSNPELQVLLSAFSMCYGSAPRDISFANHARICQGLYQSVARIRDGGDALIRSFLSAFEQRGVELRCGVWIENCLDIRNGQAGRLLLNTGEEISFESAVLTLHPREALKLIPPTLLRPALLHRVESFEPSAGFFSVFGTMEVRPGDDSNRLISLFPTTDANRMLAPDRKGDSALVIMHTREIIRGKPIQVVSAFEPCFPGEVTDWTGSTLGHRPPDYAEY
ncbi:MAG: FAD-dependent oxidoreductase, partial [Kiritimatiellia bacterium]|nr:FAD-dependent oxidoreductase [Kiritimatiellia bacterium]